MYDVPVFYATTEGQTRRIAERIAASLRAQGLGSLAMEVTSATARAVDWSAVRGVVVAASLHAGRHQGRALTFARRHAAELGLRPSLFVSVSLSAASRIPAERLAAEQLACQFTRDAGWTPAQVACVAGALAYTRYSFLTRWFMKRVARKEGGPTDTSRDHELTDWAAVANLAAAFAQVVRDVRPQARWESSVRA